MKIHLICSDRKADEQICRRCAGLAEQVSVRAAEVIVCYGGDGLMLETIKKYQGLGKKFFGLSRSDSVGFLMNKLQDLDQLVAVIEKAKIVAVPRLHASLVTAAGETSDLTAINEFRLAGDIRMVELALTINGRVGLSKFRGDGLILATPLGSSAHNYSAGGRIVPLDSQLLSLQPLAPFNPRCWRGAVLTGSSQIAVKLSNADFRPAFICADGIGKVAFVEAKFWLEDQASVQLLFAPAYSLEKKLFSLQFPS